MEECRYCYGTGLDGGATWGWGCPLCLGTGETVHTINTIYDRYYWKTHKKDTGMDGMAAEKTMNEIHAMGKDVADIINEEK